MNKLKLLNIVVFVGGVGVSLYAMHVLENVCVTPADCRSWNVTGIWMPLEDSGLILSALFGVFLVLPTHYFQAWLLRIASWALPIITFVWFGINPQNSTMPIIRRIDVIPKLLWIAFGITVLFLLYWWYYQSRRSSQS